MMPSSIIRRSRRGAALVGCLAGAAGMVRVAGAQPAVQLEINRPRNIFECDLPAGKNWYGSTDRCLKELCAGQNVFSTHILDDQNRLRRNPCYGRSPFELQR